MRRMPAIYGDASHEVVLEAAQIAHACLLLVTVPGPVVSRTIVSKARELHVGIKVAARAANIDQMEALYGLGVVEVVQPELEAGLEMTRQALHHLRIPPERIQQYADAVRREHYAPLYRSNIDYRTVTHLKDAEHQLSLNWVDIKTDSPLVNHTLGEVSIRRRTGASVVGVLREDRFHANPGAEFTIRFGDKVAVLGQPAQQAAFVSCATGPQCPTASEATANGFG